MRQTHSAAAPAAENSARHAGPRRPARTGARDDRSCRAAQRPDVDQRGASQRPGIIRSHVGEESARPDERSLYARGSQRRVRSSERRRSAGRVAESAVAAEILCESLGPKLGVFVQLVGSGHTPDQALSTLNVRPEAYHAEWRSASACAELLITASSASEPRRPSAQPCMSSASSVSGTHPYHPRQHPAAC